MMRRRGLQPQLLETPDRLAPPAVFGEWKTPGATRTIIFYAHYDGQPTDASQWTGSLPWQPVLRSAPLEAGGEILAMPKAADIINAEWRLYARSASDDKAGVIAILTAFDALRAGPEKPTSNLKFFFEGEEEIGSPHLAEILGIYKDRLKTDAWIICDGPVHQVPSLNINGIASADVGSLSRNINPATATAVLDVRLVKGNDHRRQFERLVNHVRKKGFRVIAREPTADERRKYPLIVKQC